MNTISASVHRVERADISATLDRLRGFSVPIPVGDTSKAGRAKFTGLLIETAIHRMLTGAYPEQEAGRTDDGGADVEHFGTVFDVKTNVLPSTDSWLINPVTNRFWLKKNHDSALLFCSVRPDAYLGSIPQPGTPFVIRGTMTRHELSMFNASGLIEERGGRAVNMIRICPEDLSPFRL